MNRHWILRLFAATLFALCRMFCADAQEAVDMPVDSLEKKPNLISRIIRYFEESNKERPDKKFDVTFLGGPSYSPSTSVQIAAIAAGQYHTRVIRLPPCLMYRLLCKVLFQDSIVLGYSAIISPPAIGSGLTTMPISLISL